ncbi:MAG TPA: methyl-accepting chemotaxis protein [Burkholderiaceae bacterium]|nr:methyl-accepting chemotaxis protein [Burkholderiaceae bacterium]
MLKNLKINTLIVSVLGVLMLLVAIVGVLGLYSNMNTRSAYKNIAMRDAQSEIELGQIKLLMETNRSQILQALQHNPDFEWARLHDHALDAHFSAIEKSSASIDSLWRRYYSSIESLEERRLADVWFTKSGGLGVKAVFDAMAHVKAGRWNDAEGVLIGTINPTYRVATAAGTELSEFLGKRSQAQTLAMESDVDQMNLLLGAAVCTSLLIAAATIMVLRRGITKPLAQAIAIARRVAAGDLSSNIVVHSRNELGDLMSALMAMNESLTKVVSSVRHSSDSIATGSGEIATGSADLSNRTERQASSLQQTAASMEQLAATVKQNADAAHQAEQLSKSASEVASEGGQTVHKVVATMEQISTSSKRINDIIGVIDGIAFQTNILALNAAVEAARAGEQGRGFAVVAGEVRNLAQRSAQAAKEIKTLISDSVEKVEIGSQQVGDAGRTMSDIVQQVRRVHTLISEISAATHEQTTGISQVSGAMNELDEVTQQNAALVEQSTAAAESLRQQAERLVDAVAIFKVEAQVQGA